jgi:hypothetical protein
MVEPEELKSKVNPVTIGLVIASICLGSVLGFNYAKISSESSKLEILHKFALDEVSGVRADMEKEDRAIHKELDELKEELKKRKDYSEKSNQ